MTRMFTDVGGYGIPAIPTLPNSVYSVNSVGEKRFPQNARNSQKLLAEKNLPQMSTEHTETSGREEPPTDDTDAHRCRRVWHPCHTHAAKFCVFCEFCGRTAHHKYLCKSVKSVGEKIFPQNARNLLAEKSLPQNARNTQKLLAEKSLPQMSTDAHRCRRVWHPCQTHAAKFCVFCEFCGRKEIPTERTELTETSGREEPPTDEHGCTQM